MEDRKRCARCKAHKPPADFGIRIAAPDGLHPYCKECCRQYSQARYVKHAEEIKAAGRDYRERNREALRARDRERNQRRREQRARWWQRYYAANRTAILATSDRWHKGNREKSRVSEARYREANREKRRAAGRRYYRSLPREVARANARKYAGRRRLRLSEATILPITTEQIEGKARYWGWRCWVCGGEFQAMDHVKPLAKGGRHVLVNLRPICNQCNRRKSHHWPITLADLERWRE